MVMSADHPGLTFTLSLVRTEPTYNQPMQQWSFVSDFAVSLAVFCLLFILFRYCQSYNSQMLAIDFLNIKKVNWSYVRVGERLFRHLYCEADSM